MAVVRDAVPPRTRAGPLRRSQLYTQQRLSRRDAIPFYVDQVRHYRTLRYPIKHLEPRVLEALHPYSFLRYLTVYALLVIESNMLCARQTAWGRCTWKRAATVCYVMIRQGFSRKSGALIFYLQTASSSSFAVGVQSVLAPQRSKSTTTTSSVHAELQE